jgi:hypothetical protein
LGKLYPEGTYFEDLAVFDCEQPQFAMAERSVVAKTGEVLDHYKWADPQFLNMATARRLTPGSIGLKAGSIGCHDELRTPLISKGDLKLAGFISISSTIIDDGEVYYVPLSELKEGDEIKLTIAIKLHRTLNLLDEFAAVPNLTLDEQLTWRYYIARVKLQCRENKFSFVKQEYYDDQGRLVYINASDPTNEIPRLDIVETSPYGLLRQIACDPNEDGK